MSLKRFLRERVTIVHRGTAEAPDEYNDAVPEEESRVPNVPAYAEQTTDREVTLDRQTEVSDWLMVFGPGTAIYSVDWVEWDGKVFEVVGPPSRPRGRKGEHHVEARLRYLSDLEHV